MNLEYFARVMVLVFFLALGHRTVSSQSPDFANQTLNYENVTSEKVFQTVAEVFSNEKDIDFGDYDGDGDLDVVMAVARSDFGQRRNKLYRNDLGILNEVSGASVIAGFSHSDTSRRALMRDFDRDGFLDIVIINDALSGTATIDSPGRIKLFRNVDGQMFLNETERLNSPGGAAASGVSADFDGNGFPDLMMCNHPNQTQDTITFNNINQNGPGHFQELTSTHAPIANRYGKHVETADMNGDGQIDLLVANSANEPGFIYYNNNENAGSGTGDYRYDGAGSFTQFDGTPAGTRERAMVPGDFNNDGRIDFYFANYGGFGSVLSDALQVNIGNDTDNKAVFQAQPISTDLDDESNKASISDLDGDGRVDLIVMSELRRPFIFRNTSENGEVSFVEWTPVAFTSNHCGWGAGSDNLTGSSHPDVLIGAINDDFLFEHVASHQFDEGDIAGGELPVIHDSDPVLIVGDGAVSETDAFVTSDIPAGARVSILVRSPGDVTLAVDGIAISDRPGHGTDQAIYFQHNGGEIRIQVTVEALSYDGNGDGFVNLLDVGPFVDCLTGDSADCDPFDTNDDGLVTLLDVDEFIGRLSSGASSEEYFLEILSRSD